MSNPDIRRKRRETALIAGIAACISLAAFLIYFRRGDILLYGDAVAHINIARRVFDSRTPGLLQLGTVWLPLPHLLMIPFLLSDWAWRTGVGGSIPSLLAYVAGVMGIFRLVRGALSLEANPDPASRIAAWVAALIYAANPNLIYLQSTAMTETLYLAFFIWVVVFFSEFVREAFDDVPPERQDTSHDGRRASSPVAALLKCGLCAAGAAATRYDGWFLAATLVATTIVYAFKARESQQVSWRALVGFVLLAAVVPVSWLAYNGMVYRNPLEFANGPYSARAIELRTSQPGYPPHPGSHALTVAAAYFLKSAELNMAPEKWQKVWVGLLIVGSLIAIPFSRHLCPLLLLWLPLGFYSLSVAYGGVPIFLPVWWPFSYYNVRYGLQLLPAFAVFTACVTYFLIRLVPGVLSKVAFALPACALVIVSYAGIWRAQSVCVHEAWVNSRSRMALEGELATRLNALPQGSTLLMYLGDHVGALQQAGIPMRRVIHEGNHRTWIQPLDPKGLWERSLADPASVADYVVAIDGDPVSSHAQLGSLAMIARINVPGQPSAAIYQTHPSNR